MSKLQQIKQAVTETRQAAKAIAVENCGRSGVFMSRGAYLYGVDAKGEIVYGEGDCHDLGSITVQDLFCFGHVLQRHPEIHHLSIQGGWNYSRSLRAYIDGEYDPLVSEWAVDIDQELNIINKEAA